MFTVSKLYCLLWYNSELNVIIAMTSYALFHLKLKAGDKLFALLSSFSNYKIIAIVACFMLLFGSIAYQVVQARPPSEYQLKAAFLYKPW